MADKKISELDAVLQINNDAVFPISQDNAGEPTTFKAGITQLGAEIAEDMTFSNLQTASKKIVGAINEIAQGGGGTTDYDDLENKPQINSVELSGNKSLDDLGIQPSEISKTASGSVATFTDGGVDIPVKAFECEIVAQQASGTPTPVSPLPISGFSQANISVCGINLWDEEWELGIYNVSTGVAESSTTQIRSKNAIPVKGNTTYYFSKVANRGNCTVIQYDANGTYIRGDAIATGAESGKAFTTAANTAFIHFYMGSGYGTTYTNDLSLNYPSTDTTYHAYKGNTYLVEFGQTIYGGRLVYANGAWAIEADKAMNLISDLDWSYNESGTRFSAPDLSGIIKNSESTSIPLEGLSCECYENGVSGSSRQTDLSIAVNASGTMLLKDTNYTTKADLISAVGNYKIVYPLETPVIIPLTSSTRVKTISGNNNIFSNTGEVSLEYFTDKADEIAELVEAEIASMSADYHAYSTDEQIVGRWIDGSTVYEKTFYHTQATIPSQDTQVTIADVTSLNIDILCDIFCTYKMHRTSNDTVIYANQREIQVTINENLLKFSQKTTSAPANFDDLAVVCRIRYTKTSSNTRSLNLSKGIEEKPIEEKTEDVKTEEIKEEEK